MYDAVVRKHPHISFFDGLIRVDHADDKCPLGLIYSTFTALYIYTGGLWKPHKTGEEYRANIHLRQSNHVLEVHCGVCVTSLGVVLKCQFFPGPSEITSNKHASCERN